MRTECNKVKFNNEISAEIYIKKLKATSTRTKIPQRAYLCELCLTWHLTSSDEVETMLGKYRTEIKRLKKQVTDQMNLLKERRLKISEQNIKINELQQQLKRKK